MWWCYDKKLLPSDIINLINLLKCPPPQNNETIASDTENGDSDSSDDSDGDLEFELDDEEQ